MFSVNTKNSLFTQVFNDYYALIINIINLRVNDIDTAEDLAQQVFLKLYEKFDNIESHRKWIFGTMKYELYNWYRKKSYDVNIDDIFQDVALMYANGFRDTRIILDEALNSITDEHDRLIFDLIAVQRYSYNQAGRELGMTRRQIRYRYSIVVRQVQLYLREKGIDSLEELL